MLESTCRILFSCIKGLFPFYFIHFITIRIFTCLTFVKLGIRFPDLGLILLRTGRELFIALYVFLSRKDKV
jgi:hypothetical protein